MGLGIPPLKIEIMLESNPLKSRILVWRLAVPHCIPLSIPSERVWNGYDVSPHPPLGGTWPCLIAHAKIVDPIPSSDVAPVF